MTPCTAVSSLRTSGTGPVRLLGRLGMAFLAALAMRGPAVASPPAADLPAAWQAAWSQPALADRPLQIVHRIGQAVSGVDLMVHLDHGGDQTRTIDQGIEGYRALGVGGIVTNVDFRDYLRSEEHWRTLVASVEACARLGMTVWIYDEKGYPSGSAGGLVLHDNPGWEALALALDPVRRELALRPAYEFAHPSNNYHEARRYINLIDDRAVEAFVAQTHEAYWKRLAPHFGRTIQAFFTDEPSLVAVNLGTLPEQARKRVPVRDPLDPTVRPAACVPWGYDLARQYRQRYGEDLSSQRQSLFEGQSPADRKVRRQYWSLIADLVAERYFGRLQRWCGAHRVAASGHCLAEEQPMLHVPLDGNTLKALQAMDIPGLDMLTSDPQIARNSGWLTAALPSSAAILQGRRRVMTEISDFSYRMAGRPPASLAQMQCAAAWQAAWGVTEFTLYYRPADRSAEDYRDYGRYVGRLNALLKPAAYDREVLLYYPIYDLWSEYLPVAERFTLAAQTPRGQQLVRSFLALGQALQRSQIPFTLVDHEALAAAQIDADGRLRIRGHAYRGLVLPEAVELPAGARAIVDRFARAGGKLVAGVPAAPRQPGCMVERLQPRYRLASPAEEITLGAFEREGRPVVLLVNAAAEPYRGRLATTGAQAWVRCDPASGRIDAASAPASALEVALEPYGALILLGRLPGTGAAADLRNLRPSTRSSP